MAKAHKLFLLCTVFFIALALGSYFYFGDHSQDTILMGTVEANQVIVSAQVPGRIKQMAVQEGQDVKAGDVIALLDEGELSATHAATEASARSMQYRMEAMKATADSTVGETEYAVANAKATHSAAEATLAEATAKRQHQEAIAARSVALAEKGISSLQERDTAVQAMKAAQAKEEAAKSQVEASLAALHTAQASIHRAKAAQKNVHSSMGEWDQAHAQAQGAQARLGYAKITAPISGKIGLWVSKEGEVVNTNTPLVTIIALDQTWVYAAAPETHADAMAIGDVFQVRMPSGATTEGRVLAKMAEGEFATQRDVNGRKRETKNIRIKLLIANPGLRYVPGMTAEVILPKAKLRRA